MGISINTPTIPFDKPKKLKEKSDNESSSLIQETIILIKIDLTCHGGIYSEASSSPERRDKVAVITFDMPHVAEEVCRRFAMHFA